MPIVAYLVDVLETLAQVGLHGEWISPLSQNLQKFVVREEKETREKLSFRFKILREPFQHQVQKFAAFAQIL